ncbi:MAG TPA: RHS repeat-associated core domain-containing protein, partial [Thermoanaerobaculia bacterium]|nr:RHS repeat-associated core domain-containing protein [Thermoanaerobaculia bacterium]
TWTESALEDTLTPWVLERYSEKTREIGFDAQRSTFCFDMNGRLTRQRLIAAVSEQSKDLLTQYTWDGGDVIAEGSFGGDGSNLGVQSDVCSATLGTAGYENQYTWANGVLATSRYPEPIPFLSLDYTSDPTGIVTASRATDGLATEYQYEPWGRLKSVKPPAETETVYTVTNATGSAGPKIVARRNPNPASTTDDVILRWDYDQLGRIARLERTLPGAGCVEQKITWDALGRKSAESVWAACGTSSVAATNYHYDPLGRIIRIVTPDGKESSVTWTGARIARRTADVGGASTVTEEEYDMFGRLVGVTEDAGGSRPLTTRYTWDAGDRLTSATILGGSGDQQRTFLYDGRGLLTSEQHPELGSLGNGVTTYTYDSRGHVTRKITGSFDLTYDYDSAERLAEVRETGGRVLEQYVYDDYPSFAPTPRSGKLTASVRYHYDDVLAGPSGVAVTQSFHYHSDSGKLGALYTAVGELPGVPGVTFFSARTYDALGNIDTIAYPCRTSNCSGDERTRTIDYDYTYGSLSAVSGWASSITWHPSGTINTVTHGSGAAAILESWTADPNGMPRPRSIQAKNNSGAILWTTGNYAYDGSGNITDIGPNRYTYDRFQRLTGWTTILSGSTLSTTVGYDDYGNQLYSQQEGCGASGICYSPGFLPRVMRGTTNHYADFVYDSAGNLVTDDFRTFTWDRLGMVSRTETQGRDLRFLYTAGGERVAAIERRSTQSGIVYDTTYTLRDFDNRLLSAFRTDTAGIPRWSEDAIWRNNALLGHDTAQNGIRHYTLDHLGSPRLITTATGQIAGTQTFAPFGDGGTTGGGALQFTAHERDTALLAGGLASLPDYMHARYYDAGTGRFLSVDPIPGEVRKPQSWNMYAYVQNNPLRYTDPSGLALYANTADAQKDICTMVGQNCSQYVSFDKNGKVAITATAADLKNNEALALLNDMVSSQKTYGAWVGTQMPSGNKVLIFSDKMKDNRVVNLSTTARTDIPANLNLPLPAGYDGAVGLFSDYPKISVGADGRPVSRALVLFHELAENYHRTEKLQQYVASHQNAIQRESILRQQQPQLNQFTFGSGPNNTNVKP